MYNVRACVQDNFRRSRVYRRLRSRNRLEPDADFPKALLYYALLVSQRYIL